eukprot:685157-Rhodomonas_salina.1
MPAHNWVDMRRGARPRPCRGRTGVASAGSRSWGGEETEGGESLRPCQGWRERRKRKRGEGEMSRESETREAVARPARQRREARDAG